MKGVVAVLAIVVALLLVALVRDSSAGVLAPVRASDLAASDVFFQATPACTGITGAMELAGTPVPPIGKVFVLTSYFWPIDASGYAAGFPIGVGLASVTDSSGILSTNTISVDSAPNLPSGVVSKTQTIPNGVVAIRPSTGQSHLCMYPRTGGTSLTGQAWVQGFFAPDK